MKIIKNLVAESCDCNFVANHRNVCIRRYFYLYDLNGVIFLISTPYDVMNLLENYTVESADALHAMAKAYYEANSIDELKRRINDNSNDDTIFSIFQSDDAYHAFLRMVAKYESN